MDFQTSQKDWMENNPLRTFRKQSGMSLMATASALGVTLSAIQLWENGANTPTDENMNKIAALTGDSKVGARWNTWASERPQL